MSRLIRKSNIAFLYLISLVLVSANVLVFVAGDAEEKPSFSNLVSEVLEKRSLSGALELLRNVIRQTQLQFTLPNLDFRSGPSSSAKGEFSEKSAAKKMKEAAGKSFGSSKATIEETAKAAGEVMHKTAEKVKEKAEAKVMHKTGEKVKETVSNEHDEL